jgi:hypothetical protein
MSGEIRVYEDAAGGWIVWDGTTKRIAATEQEANEMAGKGNFVAAMQAAMTAIAQASDTLDNLHSVYFDRGYGSAGADPIADGDTGIPAATVAAGITFTEQFRKFLDGQEVSAGDYDSTLNKLRTDV